jgi:D-glycero-alpha-D-manno-heptose-7-phosphate kinase
MRHKSLPDTTAVINAAAPIRVCDNGGWTDTWFAVHGKIFNVAVCPRVEVQVEVSRRPDTGPQVLFNAEDAGETDVAGGAGGEGLRLPLLEAAVGRMKVPEELALRVSVFSEAPPGASTGTSAAVTVALIAALDRLTPGRMSTREVAYLAHSVETEVLKRQSGIQDQLCAAYGGINYIEVDGYPHARVSRVRATPAVRWELERRLSLIYLGKGHNSSDVHEKVIRELEGLGPECKQLADLRRTAEASRDAVAAGDFAALGRAMAENTEAQARLHAGIVSPEASRVIEIAKRHGALGWKVNGAGGEGGTVSILGGPLSRRTRAMLAEIEASDGLFKQIATRLSPHGLRTWVIDGS